MLGLHTQSISEISSLSLDLLRRSKTCKYKHRALKNRLVDVMTLHFKFRPGALTLAHLICRYGCLLLNSGGGIRSFGSKQQRQSTDPHRDADALAVGVWTIIYRWLMSNTHQSDWVIENYLVTTTCFRCFTWETTGWVKRSSNYSVSSGKSGKERKEQCNYFIEDIKSLGRGLLDDTVLAFSRLVTTLECH